MRESRHEQPPRKQRFELLLGGHDPKDPAEATLVLVAAAALNGLRADGTEMPGRCGDAGAYDAGRPASLRAIADELNLHAGAVRRGARHLVAIGDARIDGGVVIDPEALRRRWAINRQRIRLSADVRALGLRAEPMLLVGLVAGNVDQKGQLQLGLAFLGERTGFARRTLQRALARAEERGALHRWVAPVGLGRLFLALGPSRNGARRASRNGAGRDADATDSPHAATREARERRETAPPPSRSGAPPRRETAPPPSRSGARTSGVPSGCTPGSPSGRAAARPNLVEVLEPPGTESAPPARGETGEPASGRWQNRVERWVAELAAKRIENLEPSDRRTVAAIADLLDVLGAAPADVRNPHAFRAARVEFAARVAAWARSPERLGRWLLRVSRRFGVANVGGYLRRSVDRGGDPGTVLESDAKNHVGRAAETWQDFSPVTERALEGEHRVDVARIVESGVAVLEAVDAATRDRLRDEFHELFLRGRLAAAKAVLLQLVGPRPSDLALQRAVEGVCTLADAKAVLAA